MTGEARETAADTGVTEPRGREEGQGDGGQPERQRPPPPPAVFLAGTPGFGRAPLPPLFLPSAAVRSSSLTL